MDEAELVFLRRQIHGALKHVIAQTGSVDLSDAFRVAQLAANQIARAGAPNNGRKPRTDKTRARIIRRLEERDGPGCFYCGDVADDGDYTFDHALPRARGGTRALENLRLACATCNHRKGNRTIAEYAAVAPRSVLPRVRAAALAESAGHPPASPRADELTLRRQMRREHQSLTQTVADARGADALLSGFAPAPDGTARSDV